MFKSVFFLFLPFLWLGNPATKRMALQYLHRMRRERKSSWALRDVNCKPEIAIIVLNQKR